MCLVQLDDSGRVVSLPYENLRRIKTVKMRYERTETGVGDHAERFRLRLLAHALENWNHLTGSLDRLERRSATASDSARPPDSEFWKLQLVNC